MTKNDRPAKHLSGGFKEFQHRNTYIPQLTLLSRLIQNQRTFRAAAERFPSSPPSVPERDDIHHTPAASILRLVLYLYPFPLRNHKKVGCRFATIFQELDFKSKLWAKYILQCIRPLYFPSALSLVFGHAPPIPEEERQPFRKGPALFALLPPFFRIIQELLQPVSLRFPD